MIRFLRSALFSLGMAASAVVIATVTVAAFPLPFRVRYRIAGTFAAFNLWTLDRLCGVKWMVEGREHIPPGPAIVFCKHQSTWETLALQRVFPPQVYVLKRELLWVPFFGWGLAMVRPIAIRRGSGRTAVRQLVAQGKARLAEGLWVVVFPEGTRTAPGQRTRYKVGGAVLAAESGVPVVPVAHNAGDFWPRRAFFKRPGCIRMRIGPPIATAGRTPEEILADARDWIEASVEELRRLPPDPAQCQGK